MKASEFRVGNYILDCEAEPKVTVYWQVEEVKKYSDTSGVGVVFRNGSCWSHEPEPIPLTKEWLEKFDVDYNDLELVLGYKRGCILFKDEDAFISFDITHIKYVHQLQNLYFALTGVELKIK